MDIETYMTPERLRLDLEHLKEWLSKQPHLPKIEDDRWLSTYLHHNKYSLEKTKTKLDKYFSFRNKYPEVLKSRDPQGEDITRGRNALAMCFSSRLTKHGERIIFARHTADVNIFDIWAILKHLFMIFDLIYLEEDKHDHVVQITDCRNLSYQHLLRALPGLKAGVEIFFTAYSDRLKAFHMINCPSGMEFCLNTFKGFLPQKIADRFFIHPSLQDLTKIVEVDNICSDFGGKGPTLAECDEYTTNLLEKHRKWFLEQDYVTTKEELRRKTDSEVEDMKGSFRKLEVD